MIQTISYPVLFDGNDEDGFTVTVRDIPELITQADSIHECMEMIQDTFNTVREIYIETNCEFSSPREPLSNETL